MKKYRVLSSLTAFSAGLAAFLIYHLLSLFPFTEEYLNPKTKQDSLVFLLLGLIGFALWFTGQKLIKIKAFRIALLALSFLLVVFLPCWSLFRDARSEEFFFKDDLQNFFIAELPLILTAIGFLILKGFRFFSQVLFLLFTFISLFHLYGLFTILVRAGRAFSPAGIKHLIITAAVLAVAAIFAFWNFNFGWQARSRNSDLGQQR